MPFRQKSFRRIEYFNEVTIMLCSYHYFCMTDFVPNPETRYTVGSWLIAATLLNISVNITIILMGVLTRLTYKTRLKTIRWFRMRKQSLQKLKKEKYRNELAQE